MEEDHYSKEFDDAPMPHSIFFTKIGHAIHGTDFGKPSRHAPPRMAACGCRAPTPRRCTRWCKAEGVLNTTVTLTGSSQVALARNPQAARRHRRRAPRSGPASWRASIRCRRRPGRDHAAAAPDRAAGAGGRLHLSGRRLFERRRAIPRRAAIAGCTTRRASNIMRRRRSRSTPRRKATTSAAGLSAPVLSAVSDAADGSDVEPTRSSPIA